ncbi:hypothetical protein ACIRPT_27025 [Streptomyces sp. NPDC101227]|uniref:hypothetical protein n=1 Tax=Streptomyces sp. NPDC101227 TaxID=3366136 RepID=UPI0037FD8A6D
MSSQDRKDADRAREATEQRMMGVARNFDKVMGDLTLKDRKVEKGCEEKSPNLDPHPADAPEVNCKVKIVSTYSARLSPSAVVCTARKHPEVIKWSPPKHGVCGEADYVIGDTHLIEKYRIHNARLNWTPKKPGIFTLEQSEDYFYCEKSDDDKQYCHEGDWSPSR